MELPTFHTCHFATFKVRTQPVCLALDIISRFKKTGLDYCFTKHVAVYEEIISVFHRPAGSTPAGSTPAGSTLPFLKCPSNHAPMQVLVRLSGKGQ